MSESDQDPGSPKARRKACTECRQQKARCDSYLDPTKACSRCRRMGKDCVISDPFKRENKRQRLSELQSQTEALQQQLEAVSAVNTGWPASIAPASTRPIAQYSPNAKAPGQFASPPSTFTQSALSQTPEGTPQTSSPRPTLPRTIDDYFVASKDIDCLFHIYFQNFATLVPILDPRLSPNAYYAASPLLFWVVVGIASRSYPSDPTMIGVLAPKVQNLAIVSLGQNVSLQSVQGIMLLLSWPFPKPSTGNDIAFTLCGAMLHMAMQIGLHIPVQSQEFSKVRLQLNQADIKERAETWGHCMLIYQRALLFKGSPPMPVMDIPYGRGQRKTFFDNIPARLRLELSLQEAVTQGCIAISQNGLLCMTADRESSLDTLISLFHSRIENIALTGSSSLDQIYTGLARVAILAFTFFKSPSAQDPALIFKLCNAACEIIATLDKMDRDGTISCAAATQVFYFTLMWSCHILLRILKTSFANFVDVERAKSSFLLGIGLHKRMCLQNDDLPSRNGMCLTLLWNSSKAFRRPDGSEFVELRIRSRLIGSILLDGICWWREEFGGTAGVYPTPIPERRRESTPGSDPVNSSNQIPVDVSTLAAVAMPSMLDYTDDPMLNDLGWSVGDDIFSSMWFDNAATTY